MAKTFEVKFWDRSDAKDSMKVTAESADEAKKIAWDTNDMICQISSVTLIDE
jgi:hypothetical protein